MFIPILIGLTVEKKYNRFIIWCLIILFICALILSYTRAAWVSVIGAFGIWVIIKLRIKFRTVFLFSALFILILFSFRTDIGIWLERNRQESSTDFSEHVQSISNITSDASNLERINRWKCALRMFIEKPFLGFGPGTYMFKYAPYQVSAEKTIISTNAGDRGNAHSEYIGPLAEMGIFGMLTFLFIIGFAVYTALKVYSKTRIKSIKIISLATLLGLSTYLIHGALNNFLDTDKASVPFWGFIAIIVALDVYHNNQTKKDNTKVKLAN